MVKRLYVSVNLNIFNILILIVYINIGQKLVKLML